MIYLPNAMADFEGLSSCKSRKPQAADGGKGIACADGELCGIALYYFQMKTARVDGPVEFENRIRSKEKEKSRRQLIKLLTL